MTARRVKGWSARLLALRRMPGSSHMVRGATPPTSRNRRSAFACVNFRIGSIRVRRACRDRSLMARLRTPGVKFSFQSIADAHCGTGC
jgi:hypothetical protein